MTPAFYIPSFFNLLLLFCGLSLLLSSVYFLLIKIFPWFVTFPLAAYGLHFSVFYGLISFSQLTGHILNNETMTFWSAILRFHGVITALVLVFILSLIFGRKKHD